MKRSRAQVITWIDLANCHLVQRGMKIKKECLDRSNFSVKDLIVMITNSVINAI